MLASRSVGKHKLSKNDETSHPIYDVPVFFRHFQTEQCTFGRG